MLILIIAFTCFLTDWLFLDTDLGLRLRGEIEQKLERSVQKYKKRPMDGMVGERGFEPPVSGPPALRIRPAMLLPDL